MNNMRIGIDCRMFNLQFGIGRYTHELVEHITRLNNNLKNPHQITLFFNDPEYTEFQTPPNTQKILVNAGHYSYKEQTVFLKKLNEQNCDIVHFPHFNLPVLYNKPFIVTIHDLIISLYPEKIIRKFHKHLAYKFAIRNAVKKAQKVITVSENTKKDLQKYLHVPPEKIHVIYLGVNPAFRPAGNPAATLKKFRITKPFILHTGVWRRHKNTEKLIRAFQVFRKNHDAQLVFTSRFSRSENSSPSSDIIFTDKVTESELIDLYSAARIFAFPSLYEGFGLPPLEAMACGTPVAAAKTSSIPEICGDNVVYFDPTNHLDMAEKIEKIYLDENLQNELRRKGLIHVKKFSWEKMAKETFELIAASVTTENV
ncbi:glycosyltransferase family 4 protein [Candidatus Peregrinibacteria bacterium]|nr:glycosyltransferase family 4 protein [Candidatus Peregrinibacteria bacterium]